MNKYVNGELVEMTDEEKLQMLIEGQKEKLEELENGKSLPNALELIDLICNSIKINVDGEEITKEEAESGYKMPMKLGFKSVEKYDPNNNTIYCTFEEDSEAIGTEENPIYYYDGCPLINNAFYIKEDGKRYVYMAGEWAEF